MESQQDYQHTVAAYTAQLRGLFVPSEEADATEATRGQTVLSAELLAMRAETLVDASQQMGKMTAGHLEATDRAQREAAEVKLLAQAVAEIEVARGLLEIAVEEAEGETPSGTTRSSRTAGIQRSINELSGVLEIPLEAGIQPFLKRAVRSAAERPQNIEKAKNNLQEEVDSSLKFISKRAGKVGGQAVRNLLLLDDAVLYEGVALISKDLAKLLDKVIAGLGGLVLRLVKSAVRLLLQAYDWILQLMGKDRAEQAREKIGEWVDELKKGPEEDKTSLFDKLVDRLFTPTAIGDEVKGWLQQTGAGVEQINQAAATVEELAEKYRTKIEWVERLLKGVALAKRVPFVNLPPGQVAIAAVTVGLLGYILYTGYDHVNSGRIVFVERFGFNIPDRVEGVRETVQKSLGVAEASEDIKS